MIRRLLLKNPPSLPSTHISHQNVFPPFITPPYIRYISLHQPHSSSILTIRRLLFTAPPSSSQPQHLSPLNNKLPPTALSLIPSFTSNIYSIGFTTLIVIGLGYYTLTNYQKKQFLLNLKIMNDDVFNETDEMIVFLFNRPDDLEALKPKIIEFKTSIDRLKLSNEIQYLYTFTGGVSAEDSSNKPELKLMMYKGQRRAAVNIAGDASIPTDSIQSFFTPISEDLQQSDDAASACRSLVPPSVTYNTLEEEVLKCASKKEPILLQLFEDSCFLCFLMRPFMNSLNEWIIEYNIPLKLKRYNIEKNDYAKGIPITRATPTFISYDGSSTGNKWKEFRPKEIVNRIEEQYELPNVARLKLSNLLRDLYTRFQLIGTLSVWLAQIKSIEAVLTSTMMEPPVDKDGDTTLSEKDTVEDEMHAEVVKIIMREDMERTDNLTANILVLEKEIESAERDSLLLGQMMAEALLKEETL